MVAGDPAAVDEGTRHLCPDDFYENKHRAIFHAICQIHQTGKDVNITSVTYALTDAGKIQDVGGASYIAGLPNLIPSTSLLPDYIARLTGKARDRRVFRLSQSLQQEAWNGNVSPGAVAEMRSLLESLNVPQGGASPGPRIERIGDGFLAAWDHYGVGLSFPAVREEHDEIRSAVTITSRTSSDIVWSRVTLDAPRSRDDIIKKCDKAFPALPWDRIIERTCYEIAEMLHVGEPIQELMPSLPRSSPFLISKILEVGETTVRFGDGGSGKSYMALAEALALSVMLPLPNGLIPSRQANSLILDGETNREVHEERLGGLMRGLGVSQAPGIFYRPMTRALADDMTFLRVYVVEKKIDLVIVDSFGMACGVEPEKADSAIRLMNALRSLGPTVTKLVIAHVSKASADTSSGTSRPYGSVYVQNLARSSWEVRGTEDESGDALSCGLFHRKFNNGRKFPPMAFRFKFQGDAIRLLSSDLTEFPDLMARTSIQSQILQFLKDGRKPTAEVAEGLSIKSNVARMQLSRLKGMGKVIPFPGGPGKDTLWALPQEEPAT